MNKALLGLALMILAGCWVVKIVSAQPRQVIPATDIQIEPDMPPKKCSNSRSC